MQVNIYWNRKVHWYTEMTFAFSFMKVPSIGILLPFWDKNHLKTTLSMSGYLLSLTFLHLFEDFSNAVKIFFSIFKPGWNSVLRHPIFFRKIFIGNAIFQVSQSLAFLSQSFNSQLSFNCHVEAMKKQGEKIQTLFEHSNLKIRTKVRDNERKTV